MKITRDVIYDLLPGYFAGDTSADTRALIDEFFATDPEFGRMAERFRQLYDDSGRARRAPVDGTPADAPATDVPGFHEARSRAERRQIGRGLAIGYTIAALFTLGMTFIRNPSAPRGPGLFIAAVFGVVALLSGISAALVTHDLWPGAGRFRRRRARQI